MPERYDHTLKEVIRELIQAYRWKGKLDVVRLENSWDKIVGKVIAAHTQKLSVKDRVLYIRLDSSVIRNELMMAKSTLIRNINEEMGEDVIEEIVIR